MVEAGVAPLTVQICKQPDGSDWLLGVGGYAKVKPFGQKCVLTAGAGKVV